VRIALAALALAAGSTASMGLADDAPVAKPQPPAAADAASSKPGAFKESLGRAPSSQDLKPTGPIDITADHLESVVGNTAVYTGNVKLVSNTLKLDGDRLELRQYGKGQYEAHLTGNPGHMNHAGAGPDNPPVDARAKILNYDMRDGYVDLIGDAYLKRCNDTINAETMRYNVATHSYDATRGDGGQVHIILQPDSPVAVKTGTPCGPAESAPPVSQEAAP
jgi:lipopolysaccharide transport protein LptA